MRVILLPLISNLFFSGASWAENAHFPTDMIGILDVSERYSGERDPIFNKPNDWLSATWGEDESQLKSYTIARNWANKGDHSDWSVVEIALSDFELIETDYEQSHIIVYAKKADWVRVKISGEATWIREEPTDMFVPYTSLVLDSLAYLTSWNVLYSDRPNGPLSSIEFKPGLQSDGSDDGYNGTPDIQVVDVLPAQMSAPSGEHEKHPGWIKIRITDGVHCSTRSYESETTLFEGWIPSHRPDGEVSVWFYARGC